MNMSTGRPSPNDEEEFDPDSDDEALDSNEDDLGGMDRQADSNTQLDDE